MKPLGSVQSSSGSLFRRSNGRGLSAAGAVIVVLGALPAWWTISGSGLAPEIGNAFDSPGFVGFFAALAALAVIIAPEAVGEPLRIDWWPTHLVLVCIATSAFLLAAGGAAVTATGNDLPLSAVFGLNTAPGLWVTLVGLGVWIAGAAQIVDARNDR